MQAIYRLSLDSLKSAGQVDDADGNRQGVWEKFNVKLLTIEDRHMWTGKLKSLACLAALPLMVLSLTGCQTLGLPANPKSIPAAPIQGQASKGQYRVEITGPFAKPRAELGSITNKTTVQTALESSNALAKFRGADITVLRKTEDGRGLKMPVQLQPNKKVVKFEQDYALHPGDRVIVTGKSMGVLDKFVTDVFGDQDF